MTPEEYRQQQTAITASVESRVLSVLLRLLRSGKKLTPKQFTAVVLRLKPTIVTGRADSVGLAATFYADERKSRNVKSTFDPHSVTDVEYSNRGAFFALQPARSPLLGLEQFERDEAEARMRHAAGYAGMHVEQAGRDGIVTMSKLDPQCLGWARTDPIPPSCAFCVMLLSRGPVYGSESSAVAKTGGGTYHPNDTCIAVPVFNRSSWLGMELHAAALQTYIAASRLTNGDTSRSAIVAAINRVLAPAPSSPDGSRDE